MGDDMNMKKEIQRRLMALGYPLPRFGADGDFGAETQAAINKALDDLERLKKPVPTPAPSFPAHPRVVPPEWMPPAKMKRIICHWTAGTHDATAFDRSRYHILVEGDGDPIRGTPSIKLNESPIKTGYAAHTLGCNSDSIAVSLCCMGGANEGPFDPGKWPMTREQWETMTSVLADLCLFYKIPVTDTTVLSHAEVQNNLGIAQRGKWDFTRLAFDPTTVGAKACGDKMRTEVKRKMGT